MKIQMLDPTDWRRHGRGKSFEVSLPVDSFVDQLIHTKEAVGGDWFFITTHMRQGSDGYQAASSILPLEDIPSFVERAHWQFFLWSPSLSPFVAEYRCDELTVPFLSVNGLINIQCGRKTRLGIAKPAISIVDVVEKIDTGETITHHGYLQVFQAIRKSFMSVKNSSQAK